MLGVLTGGLLAATAGTAPAATPRQHPPVSGTAAPGGRSVSAAARIAHPELDVAGAEIKRVEGTVGAAAPNRAGPSGTARSRAGRSGAGQNGAGRSRVGTNRSAAAGSALGMDVSSHQGSVDFDSAASNGATFAYVKATEGTGYTSPYFDDQFSGAGDAGMYRGAYHFALPDKSNGVDQAEYFLANGGSNGGDGSTLPPALDIEYNPYGDTCYGLRAPDMVRWLHDFTGTVARRTGRAPVIYTSTKWWARCTGNDRSFGRTDPLWVPAYGSSVGALPAGWDYQTFWQFADSGSLPGDQDRFNGSYDRLAMLAG